MMKSKLVLIFLGCLIIVNTTLAQEIKISDLTSDTLTRGQYTSYVASDGAVYKVGDRIKFGDPSSDKTYVFIKSGDGLITPVKNVSSFISGAEAEILRINVVGNQRGGFSVYLHTRPYGGGIANYTVHFEYALKAGEIRSVGMTSEEAILKLRKAKEKLDLQLITQEEYDKIKAELGRFIK